MQFAGRDPAADVVPGHWIAAAVCPGAGLAEFLPPLFPAAARVLHPAASYVGADDVDVRWAAVAAANGTVVHPLVEWGALTGSLDFYEDADQSPLWEGAPARGHLPVQVADVLVDVLGRHTTTPDDCWFGVWDGHPGLTSGHPRLTVARRAYWLVRGPLALACENLAVEPAEQSANLWWPADHAWCVLTDPELVTTFIGGTTACIDALLADPRLECVPARPDQPLGEAADTVNPPPDP